MGESDEHKKETWNLSTNTAAEFGDLGALAHRLSKQRSNNDRAVITAATADQNSILNTFNIAPSEPLHLAAQHGHIAITNFLLQRGYDVDTGVPRSLSSSLTIEDGEPISLATPIHRACFSGAIGCVHILLENGANLFVKDNSFGDLMTPLHKAVKGGRYNAVALILIHVMHRGRKICCGNNSEGNTENSEVKNLMRKIIEMVDSRGRTPLDLAKELDANGEEEVSSVRRWDIVAGGTAADFHKCVQLVQNAKKIISNENIGYDGIEYGIFSEDGMNALLSGCPSGDGSTCDTAAWEIAYQNSLLKSIGRMINCGGSTQTGTQCSSEKGMINSAPMIRSLAQKEPIPSSQIKETINNAMEIIDETNVEKELLSATNNSMKEGANTGNISPVGQPCKICKAQTIALFRLRCGGLVCRKCKRKYRNNKIMM